MSTVTNTTIWFVGALSLIVDVRTYIRTYVWTDGRTFLPGLLGHLSGDDLKIGKYKVRPCGTYATLSLCQYASGQTYSSQYFAPSQGKETRLPKIKVQ